MARIMEYQRDLEKYTVKSNWTRFSDNDIIHAGIKILSHKGLYDPNDESLAKEGPHSLGDYPIWVNEELEDIYEQLLDGSNESYILTGVEIMFGSILFEYDDPNNVGGGPAGFILIRKIGKGLKLRLQVPRGGNLKPDEYYICSNRCKRENPENGEEIVEYAPSITEHHDDRIQHEITYGETPEGDIYANIREYHDYQ